MDKFNTVIDMHKQTLEIRPHTGSHPMTENTCDDPNCWCSTPQGRFINSANPKDLLGIKKISLHLLPAAGKIYGALAMKDGAKKYGSFNWRSKKVRMTVYLSAIERHLLALQDGENKAEDSGLPHLAHIIANASILADAVEGGFLEDDRPLPGPAPKLLKEFEDKS